jgi:ribonuclease HII
VRPSFKYEDQYSGLVCGLDEVGRGPLAGPVVAAAVIIHRDKAPLELLDQINDSKKLTAPKRAYLFQKIPEFCDVSIAECSVDEIDSINILQASLLAMKKAFEGLPVAPKAALVDGNKAPKLPCAVKTIVQGDSHSLSIAAASIMAKHHRDQIMKTYAIDFPHYGWESNSGYGSKQHLQAIEIHGITPHHRRSFAPISKQLVKLNAVNN